MHPDLTPDEVYSACVAVMEAERLSRHAITGHAVWKFLGRGGKGTVQKYTKEWREMSESNPSDDRLTLTSVMASIEQSVGNLLEQSVNAEVSRAQTREEELAAEIAPFKEALVSAHMKIDELNKQIAHLRALDEDLERKRQDTALEKRFLEQQLRTLKDNFDHTVNVLASLAKANGLTDEQNRDVRRMVDALRGIPTTDRKGNPKRY